MKKTIKQRESTALRSVPLFSTLSADLIGLLANVVSTRQYPKNTLILSSGDKTDSLYIIISGNVKVGITDDDGKEVILSFLGPGDFFGEMALIDDYPRSADIVTREPCELMIIEQGDFKKCLAMSSALSMQIMLALVSRLRDADRKIESLALVNVYGRVAQVLLESAEQVDGVLAINRKLSRQDIAKLVGASREMVTRVMRDLVDGGYIRTEPKRIVLSHKLESYAKEIGHAHTHAGKIK